MILSVSVTSNLQITVICLKNILWIKI